MAAFPASTIGKLFNLTERRIQQLAKEGVIPKAERGKYDLGPCVQGYIKYLQERAEGRGAEPKELHTERARLVCAQADKTEIEVQERKGLLIPAEGVIEAWEQLVGAFRAKCLALPSKLAPQLAAVNEIREIKEYLAANLREALEELSRFELPGPGTHRVAGSSQEGDQEGGANREAPARAHGERVGKRKPQAQPRGQRRAGTVQHP